VAVGGDVGQAHDAEHALAEDDPLAGGDAIARGSRGGLVGRASVGWVGAVVVIVALRRLLVQRQVALAP
jgi:hypothetical protein